MTIDIFKLKEKVLKSIDDNRDKIIQFGEDILRNPELGFKEYETAQKVAEKLNELGLSPKTALAITGVKASIQSKTAGPGVAVLGELDGIICSEAKFANPETGAAHVCGHNAQLAAMVGVATGFVEAEAMDFLSGQIIFLATPAEEPIEITFREELRRANKIRFIGGKQELIHNHEFDDIDIAMVVHALPNSPRRVAEMNTSMNGFISKKVDFMGKPAHAGMMPHEGINALNAASLGIMAINMQRETFKDDDHVRIHCIVIEGGKSVNVVPDKVSLDFHVRGKTFDVIREASFKVDRALKSAGAANGTKVFIQSMPGFLPVLKNKSLSAIFEQNLSQLIGAENITCGEHSGGVSDMGDVTHTIPAIHPFMGGFKSSPHKPDFEIVDMEMAYIMPAKCMAMTIIDLLSNEAKLAKNIQDEFVPRIKKDDYTNFMQGLID